MKQFLCAVFAALLCSILCSGRVCAQQSATPAVSATAQITIFHTNDFHSRLERADALVQTIFRLRAQRPDSILLDAGDMFESGSEEAALTKGRAVVEMMNRAGYDGMTLGDGAFRGFDLEDMRRCIQEFAFPVLSSNLVSRDNGDPITIPYWIYTVGAVRVGVIGAYNDEPIRDSGLHAIDAQTVVEYYAYHLKGKTDCIVALTHAGLKNDKALAKAVPVIDVIVGGSSNDALEQPLVLDDTIIVQAGSVGRFVGVLNLTVDLDADKIIAHSGRLEPVSEQ